LPPIVSWRPTDDFLILDSLGSRRIRTDPISRISSFRITQIRSELMRFDNRIQTENSVNDRIPAAESDDRVASDFKPVRQDPTWPNCLGSLLKDTIAFILY